MGCEFSYPVRNTNNNGNNGQGAANLQVIQVKPFFWNPFNSVFRNPNANNNMLVQIPLQASNVNLPMIADIAARAQRDMMLVSGGGANAVGAAIGANAGAQNGNNMGIQNANNAGALANGAAAVQDTDDEDLWLATHPDIEWRTIEGQPFRLPNGLVCVKPMPTKMGLARDVGWTYADIQDDDATFRKIVLDSSLGQRGVKVCFSVPFPIHVFMISSLPGDVTRQKHGGQFSSYKCPNWCTAFITYRNQRSHTIRWIVQLNQVGTIRGLLRPIGDVRRLNSIEDAGDLEYV